MSLRVVSLKITFLNDFYNKQNFKLSFWICHNLIARFPKNITCKLMTATLSHISVCPVEEISKFT
jgi:hypothetical protein